MSRLRATPLSAPRSRRATPGAAPPRLVSLATALPPHRIDQSNARDLVAALFAGLLEGNHRRLLDVFDHSGVESRRICMPLSWYRTPHDFGETNALYLEHALSLAVEVSSAALERAGLAPADVDHVVFVSSTGVATPSVDARLANSLGFRTDVRRTPIWGLGCAGGAVGLSRARDFALADPGARVLLVALELCSLTFQAGDLDTRNLVAASLFSDGAAAALIVGGDAAASGASSGVVAGKNGARSGDVAGSGAKSGDSGNSAVGARSIELLASRSTLWKDSLDVMGWTVDASGLHVVFSRDIPSIVRERARPNLEQFLHDQGLSLAEIAHVIAHPGGPKVLAAYAETLGLPLESFHHAREVLRTCGNMSSPTCLFVLERVLASGELRPGQLGVVAALGPGFSSELVLVRGSD